MDKRALRRFTDRTLGAIRDLPLLAKLLVISLLPLLTMLSVTVPLSANSLNRMENSTSTARLRDEVRIVNEQIAELETSLIMDAHGLASDPLLIQALERNNKAMLATILITERSRLGLSHLQMVDASGQVIGREHHGHGSVSGDEFKRLHELGLLEIQTTKLTSSATGWLLTAVRPIKSRNDLLGALSIGRLLDKRALSKLNFDRADPLLVLLDGQGNITAASNTDTSDSAQATRSDMAAERDSPDEFNSCVLEFLERVEAGARA